MTSKKHFLLRGSSIVHVRILWIARNSGDRLTLVWRSANIQIIDIAYCITYIETVTSGAIGTTVKGFIEIFSGFFLNSEKGEISWISSERNSPMVAVNEA